MQSNRGAKGGRPGRAFYLNEEQALLLVFFSRTAVASDVRRALGQQNTATMVKPLLDDEKGVGVFYTPGGPQRLTFVTESGLYKIALRAQRSNPAVAKLQDWVAREVLPAIRKDGAYIMGEEKVRTGEMSEDELGPQGVRHF